MESENLKIKHSEDENIENIKRLKSVEENTKNEVKEYTENDEKLNCFLDWCENSGILIDFQKVPLCFT